jgi:tRNA(His) 5'-end guanylyltransferase
MDRKFIFCKCSFLFSSCCRSFVFQDKTELYQRQESLILSSCTSRFTLFYMMKWKDFFPNKDLVEPPHFEAELLCYPKQKILCDYLSSRQAECHTTNQYSTCFWMLVKSGKSENEAREILKVFFHHFGLNISPLLILFDALVICSHNSLTALCREHYQRTRTSCFSSNFI